MSKYNSVKTEVDGMSLIQAERLEVLKHFVKIATIRDLEIKVQDGKVIGFKYYDYRINKIVEE